ncbi:MAG: DUF2281 domain-containing protein [Methylovulum sp.]|uniref:DUF2281 domain-containing protein n=1 Tax=Methylovulum sp. TaxID=1916980 RepID=UPI002629DCF9|nr:DUF2281 domain-containing protein [Methylovulum sp.]MDD2722995.1 DUF2281 domain-containing protein [Methylovulum sp.]
MHLDEQLHQHLDLLPMDLKAEVLDFVLFLEQKQERQAKEHLTALMSVIPASVSLVDELLADRRLETDKEHSSQTQSLVGALQNTESLLIEEDNTQELLEMLRKIKPVKCEYTSEQIVRSLRDGTALK